VAVRAKAVLRGEPRQFGSLPDEAGKRRTSPRIPTSFIEPAYEVAMRAGALDGRVAGRVLFCRAGTGRHRRAAGLTRTGAAVTDLSSEPRGLAAWRA
jgi:galactokinase/mevalonate kinase-like predicted kinase